MDHILPPASRALPGAVQHACPQYHSSQQITSKEGKNHRMVGVARDLCGSSSPTFLPKQGHLQQAAQDLVQRTRKSSKTKAKSALTEGK